MGNSTSKKLSEEYKKKNFKLIGKFEEDKLGKFQLIQFKHFHASVFFRKMIDPNLYDKQFANVGEIVKNL